MTFQQSLDLSVSFADEAYEYGARADGETHGVVLTKPHIVDLILDLAGYTADRDLGALRLLEPACGHGVFVGRAVQRLIRSAALFGRTVGSLGDALAAFDVDRQHVEEAQRTVVRELVGMSVDPVEALRMANRWVRQADFLLAPQPDEFDIVVGNPPYIRIEQLSGELQAEYRRRYATLYDRADLYVAFIERSLSLLSAKGVLAFICANRWTLNRYGAPLRRLITSRYRVLSYVSLDKGSPFESDVAAYPSIFVIGRERRGEPIRVIKLADASGSETAGVATALSPSIDGSREEHYSEWFDGDDPWVLSSPAHLAVLRDLERRLPRLEDGGETSVRIGVATGNDSVYIVGSDSGIESDRLVPLVMRDDIEHGRVRNAGRFVINTFADQGTVELSQYPRLSEYLARHREAIMRRHVASKSGSGWFRTIDRVYPELASRPKLLIPDIAGSNQVVLETGSFYPHHNLYFILSSRWDLEVLGGLLSSRIALFFVWSYAVKMRGGYLRFQAQYLRRIRVPSPETIDPGVGRDIATAFRSRDFVALDELARRAYSLRAIPQFDFLDTRK